MVLESEYGFTNTGVVGITVSQKNFRKGFAGFTAKHVYHISLWDISRNMVFISFNTHLMELCVNILWANVPTPISSAYLDILFETSLGHGGAMNFDGHANALMAFKNGELYRVRQDEVEKYYDIIVYDKEEFIKEIKRASS